MSMVQSFSLETNRVIDVVLEVLESVIVTKSKHLLCNPEVETHLKYTCEIMRALVPE